jgi:hypothetical protein
MRHDIAELVSDPAIWLIAALIVMATLALWR